MDEDMLSAIRSTMKAMNEELRPIAQTFLEDASVNARLRGLGHLDKEQALLAGAVGPMLRASGIDYDARETGYAAYDELNFGPITAVEGDSYARVKVRIAELFQSFELIEEIISKIPQGELSVPVKGMPKGEAFIRIEQPRGGSHLLYERKRHQISGPLPAAHPDHEQYPADARSAERMSAGRCGPAHPDHRSLHQLYREVSTCERSIVSFTREVLKI